LKVLNALRNTQFDDEIIPTKLYPKNVNVDRINDMEITKLKASGYKRCLYKAEASKGNELSQANIAKYDVELVENAQVIVTRNIDIGNGVVNGMRGVVKKLFNDFAIVKDCEGNLHTISYYKDVFEKTKSYILHLPLKVSYALSIHKSQGMTIDALEIDLGDNIFTCGQAYTALSRAKSLRSIRVMDVSKDSFKINQYVKAFYSNI
jgi:ATP-dependent DNA helicase PIF1